MATICWFISCLNILLEHIEKNTKYYIIWLKAINLSVFCIYRFSRNVFWRHEWIFIINICNKVLLCVGCLKIKKYVYKNLFASSPIFVTHRKTNFQFLFVLFFMLCCKLYKIFLKKSKCFRPIFKYHKIRFYSKVVFVNLYCTITSDKKIF